MHLVLCDVAVHSLDKDAMAVYQHYPAYSLVYDQGLILISDMISSYIFTFDVGVALLHIQRVKHCLFLSWRIYHLGTI